MPELLEFEEPIGILLREIEALSKLPDTEQRRSDIIRLEERITQIRGELYRTLTPWQRVLVARHPSRPTAVRRRLPTVRSPYRPPMYAQSAWP